MYNVSSEFLTKIKEASRRLNARVGVGGVDAVNITNNGNMAQGTNFWDAVNGSVSNGNNTLTVTLDGSADNGYAYQNIVEARSGDKVYARAKVRVTNSVCTDIVMYANTGGGSHIFQYQYTPVQDQWYYISGVITLTEALDYLKIQHRYADAGTANGKVMEIQEITMINLTDVYGGGGEPSKAEMDTLMETIGWFDTPDVNLVQFGDYNQGTRGWTTVGVSGFSVTSGVASFTASWQYGKLISNKIQTIKGHKYYMRGILKDGSTSVALAVSLNVSPYTTQGIKYMTKTDNTFETVSNTFTATESRDDYYLGVIDFRPSGFTQMSCKEMMVIDLTATYGVGSEPSLEVMDSIIDTYGWFDYVPKNIPQTLLDTETIVNFDIESSFGSKSIPNIGGVVANKLELQLLNDVNVPQILVGVPLRPYVALEITTDNFEWVTLGEYYAEDSELDKTEKVINLESYDRMTEYGTYRYDTNLTYPAKIEDMLVELAYNYPNIRFEDRTAYSRNICVTQFQDWESGWYNTSGNKEANSARIRLGGGYVRVEPNETYYFNTFNDTTETPQFSINTFDEDGVFVRHVGAVVDEGTVTMATNEHWLAVSLVDVGDSVDYDWWENAFANYEIRPFICNNALTDKSYDIFLPHIRFPEAPVGTVRQILGMIASVTTRNTTINEDGDISFRLLEDSGFGFDANNYIDFLLTSDSTVKLSQLQVASEEEGVDPIVYGDTSGFALEFNNPAVTNNEELQIIYDREFPLNYYSYKLTAQGMPHLQLGDTIEFTDKESVTRTLIIINHKLRFNGGLRSIFKVDAPKEEKTEITVTSGSSIKDAIDQSHDNLLVALDEATKLITGNNGGYVITILDENTGKPTELVISNTENINDGDAHLWRWNSSGLGYSETGYNGTFKLAITSDGEISADFMTTGTLTADIVKAGILKSVNESSWIDMENGTFSLADGKLDFDGTTFTINYSGTNLDDALATKADSSDLDDLNTYVKFDDGITLGEQSSPLQISIDNESMQFLDTGGTLTQLTSTAITGDGATATATFATQATIPYPVGSTITIANAIPVTYNGTFIVTGATTSSVSWASTETTTATTQGIITKVFVPDANTIAYVNGKRMLINDLEAVNSLTVGFHKIEKHGSNITLIKYIG